MSGNAERARYLDAVFIGVLVIAGLLGPAMMALTPGDAAPGNFASGNLEPGLAVVFAPWISERDAIQRAVEPGARFVRQGGLPFIVVVAPDDRDYSDRMKSAGAWFFADPRILDACLKTRPSTGGRA